MSSAWRRPFGCSTSSWPPASTCSPSPAASVPTRPRSCPERREEVTTEGGLDLRRPHPRLRETIRRLDEAGSASQSLHRSRIPRRSTRPRISGVPAIELHTGRYANSWRDGDTALDELRRAARHAADMGLFVHAGHGLTYDNVVPVAGIPEIEELNIGHSVVSRAVMVGMRRRRRGDARTWCGARGADTFRRMTNPLASADFFALEAGECLDRLESLVARPEGPPPRDEFLRTARVLRGSALMAGQQPIARAAAGLEGLARAYRDGRRPWDPATREQIGTGDRGVSAAGAPRARVGRGRHRAHRAARPRAWSRSPAGRRPSPRPRATSTATCNTGVRAFVAREGALIASALDRAARALRAAPTDREPLYTVIRRMQSLRGLAELGELAPLPEILDGIELAVGDLTRLFAPPPGRGRGDGRRVGRAHPDLARHRRPTADPSSRPRRRSGSPTCCCAPLPSSATSCRSSRSTTPATPSP